MPIREPRVFTIPAGAPFLPTLAVALLEGRLVEGFPREEGPLALTGATIFVPTQRSAAALAQALVKASGGNSLLLPHIAPLGAFGSEETSLVDSEELESGLSDLPSAAGELTRRHVLAILIRKWGETLKGAIRHGGPDGLLFDD